MARPSGSRQLPVCHRSTPFRAGSIVIERLKEWRFVRLTARRGSRRPEIQILALWIPAFRCVRPLMARSQWRGKAPFRAEPESSRRRFSTPGGKSPCARARAQRMSSARGGQTLAFGPGKGGRRGACHRRQDWKGGSMVCQLWMRRLPGWTARGIRVGI